MHEFFLQRCCDLANLADSRVSPNPRVGAVLVHEGRIIGEGYHSVSGQAHAEVKCVASVKEKDRALISSATLYVSLEPCCFVGRTPACTSLIQENKIPRVVIGQRDKTAAVNGQGVQILIDAGVEVLEFPDFKPAERVVAPRQLFAAEKRPYTLLKFAQSADGYLAPLGNQNYWITNSISRRIVHFWRSRTSAIVIGAGTLLADNPKLNTRLYPGKQPIPVVIDPKGRIQHTNYQLFERSDNMVPVLLQPSGTAALNGTRQVFIDFPDFPDIDYQSSIANGKFQHHTGDTQFHTEGLNTKDALALQWEQAAQELVTKIYEVIHKIGVNHITIEGGAWLLSLFITTEKWDEVRTFKSATTFFGSGIVAPVVSGQLVNRITIGDDLLEQYAQMG